MALRRPARRPHRISKRVVDAGEDGVAFQAPSDVDESDDLRPNDGAEAHAVAEVEIRHRRVEDVMEHLTGFGEGRDLELGLHAEERVLPDTGPELGGPQGAVEVDETLRAEAAQRPPATELTLLPEGSIALAADVVGEEAQGQHGV